MTFLYALWITGSVGLGVDPAAWTRVSTHHSLAECQKAVMTLGQTVGKRPPILYRTADCIRMKPTTLATMVGPQPTKPKGE